MRSLIVGGARTPIGKLLGALKDLTATDLGGIAIAGALERSGLEAEHVEFVVMGQVLQAGAGQIPSRQAHDLIAGIAQDPEGRAAARGDRVDVDPAEIDRQTPDQEFLILDADSTQHRAIACALSGQNGVISGPPGTGKRSMHASLSGTTMTRRDAMDAPGRKFFAPAPWGHTSCTVPSG